MTRPRADRGFTLLEVMVAFIIAALAATALLRGAGTGLAAARAAADVQDATSRARSRLAVLSAGPFQPGEESGTEGRFRWRTAVSQLAAMPRQAGGALPQALYALTATVSWDARREVTLQTRRIGPAQAAPP